MRGNINDTAASFYGAIATFNGEQLGTVDLPGPVLGQDDYVQLYIRLSNIPDKREIGIYEVIIPDQLTLLLDSSSSRVHGNLYSGSPPLSHFDP